MNAGNNRYQTIFDIMSSDFFDYVLYGKTDLSLPGSHERQGNGLHPGGL